MKKRLIICIAIVLFSGLLMPWALATEDEEPLAPGAHRYEVEVKTPLASKATLSFVRSPDGSEATDFMVCVEKPTGNLGKVLSGTMGLSVSSYRAQFPAGTPIVDGKLLVDQNGFTMDLTIDDYKAEGTVDFLFSNREVPNLSQALGKQAATFQNITSPGTPPMTAAEVAAAQPEPTATPAPTETPAPTQTPEPTATVTPTKVPLVVEEPVDEALQSALAALDGADTSPIGVIVLAGEVQALDVDWHTWQIVNLRTLASDIPMLFVDEKPPEGRMARSMMMSAEHNYMRAYMETSQETAAWLIQEFVNRGMDTGNQFVNQDMAMQMDHVRLFSTWAVEYEDASVSYLLVPFVFADANGESVDGRVYLFYGLWEEESTGIWICAEDTLSAYLLAHISPKNGGDADENALLQPLAAKWAAPEKDAVPPPEGHEAKEVAATDVAAYWDSLEEEVQGRISNKVAVPEDGVLEETKYLRRRGYLLLDGVVYKFMDPSVQSAGVGDGKIGWRSFEKAIEDSVLQQVFPEVEGRRQDTFVYQGRTIKAYISSYSFGEGDRSSLVLQLDTAKDFWPGIEYGEEWYPVLNVTLQYGTQPYLDWDYCEWTDTNITFYYDNVEVPPDGVHIFPFMGSEAETVSYPLPRL